MTSASEAAARLAEIDALQDELLDRLADLERRCEEVLATCQGSAVAKATIPMPQVASAQSKRPRRKAA